MFSITPAQFAQLQTKVTQLGVDLATAASAKLDSDTAHVTLNQAQTDTVAKDAVENAANDVVTADSQDLQSFIDGLAAPVVVPPVTPSPAPALSV